MERMLVQEFPPLALEERSGKWEQITGAVCDWRILTGASNNYWINESTLDLSGYALQDMTLSFRRSFEQYGGPYFVSFTIEAASGVPPTLFSSIQPGEINIFENIMILSVPMNDVQLIATVLNLPGFIPLPSLDNGNFNRTHIIHGHKMNHLLNTTFGADALQNTDTTSAVTRNAYLLVADDNVYSSLEPTAADCLYCYRIAFLPDPRANSTSNGMATLTMPPCRVILDSVTTKEDDIEYLMRLKRSYELANQV